MGENTMKGNELLPGQNVFYPCHIDYPEEQVEGKEYRRTDEKLMKLKIREGIKPITYRTQQDARQFIDAELPPVRTDGHRPERHEVVIEHIVNTVGY